MKLNTVTEYHDTIPEGYVIRTEPGADTQVDSGTVVVIYVSAGAQSTYTEVPSVLNYRLEDAKMILNSAGIRIGNVQRVDSNKESSTVLDQSLTPGTQVPIGTTIDLVIVMERETEKNAVELMIPLPNTSNAVSMRAELGGTTVVSETVIPSEIGGYWTISVLGEGIGTLTIYYDNQLYRAYSINFSEQTTMMVTDNSENFGG